MPKAPSDKHDTQVTPDPALEKRTRRVFPVELPRFGGHLNMSDNAQRGAHG